MFPSKGNWLIYFKTKWKALLHKFCVYVLNALHLGCTKQNYFLTIFFISACQCIPYVTFVREMTD